MLQTERLILRPWKEDDAEELFRYAQNPRVGPITGWPPHASVEDSRRIIRDVLSTPENYAVVLKDTGLPVGSIGLLFGEVSQVPIAGSEAGVGYWIGVPYWGCGLIPEALREITRHAFEDLGLDGLRGGYFDGNLNSKRVLDKCGFVYHHTEQGVSCRLMGDVRTEHFTYLSKSRWKKGGAIEIRRMRQDEHNLLSDQS